MVALLAHIKQAITKQLRTRHSTAAASFSQLAEPGSCPAVTYCLRPICHQAGGTQVPPGCCCHCCCPAHAKQGSAGQRLVSAYACQTQRLPLLAPGTRTSMTKKKFLPWYPVSITLTAWSQPSGIFPITCSRQQPSCQLQVA